MSFLLKPFSFLIIVFGGYMLKRIGFFHKDDHRIVSRIVMTITLPGAVIHAFEGFQRDSSQFFLILLGFACCGIPLLTMFIVTRKQDKMRRVLHLFNVSGYNIGCFALPMIQSFFGTTGAAIACMVDIGNAMLVTGGSYAIVSTVLHIGGEEKQSAKTIVKKFFTSVPFDLYMVMLLLVSLNISIPQWIMTMTAPIASANSFLAMLMIGLMIEPASNKEYLRQALCIVGWRLLFSTCFSLLLYFCTPFALPVRQVLAVIVFAPIGSLGPVYTQRCGGDGALASFASSISFCISMVAMTALVIVMGINNPV